MTKEEQLDWLRRLKSDIPWMDFSIDIEVSLKRKEQYGQVLSEVIKALGQEPRKGHWIMPNKDKTDRPMAECSKCGWYVNPNWIKEYSFCPNCGADMRGEKDD